MFNASDPFLRWIRLKGNVDWVSETTKRLNASDPFLGFTFLCIAGVTRSLHRPVLAVTVIS